MTTRLPPRQPVRVSEPQPTPTQSNTAGAFKVLCLLLALGGIPMMCVFLPLGFCMSLAGFFGYAACRIADDVKG